MLYTRLKFSKGVNNLRTFGDMCYATAKKVIQGKLNDRCAVSLSLGCPEKDSNDLYKIFNLQTKPTFNSRDSIWLDLRYGNGNKSKNYFKFHDNEDISYKNEDD
jgi:hypothetical protein